MNCKTNAWVIRALNFIFIIFSISNFKNDGTSRQQEGLIILSSMMTLVYQISIALSLYLKHFLSVIKIFVQYISMRHMNLSLKASSLHDIMLQSMWIVIYQFCLIDSILFNSVPNRQYVYQFCLIDSILPILV